MSDLSNRLRWCRERRGWSQSDAAEKAGITNFALSKYELGKREPDARTLVRLAKLYGVSLDFLLDGVERETVLDLADVLQNEDKLNFYGVPLNDTDRSLILEILTAILRDRIERTRE
jgi:transcriptional regulator with XRE-family HTH domain